MAIDSWSEARLHRDRQVDRVDDAADDAGHLLRLLQEPRPGAVAARHVLDRAADVDVDQLGAGLRGDLRRLDHDRGIGAVDLDPDGPLPIVDLQLLQADAGVPDQPLGGDELGVDDVGAQPPADEPERLVGDVLHRRQQQRPVEAEGSDRDHSRKNLRPAASRVKPPAPARAGTRGSRR
jgi:hypothetical protein